MADTKEDKTEKGAPIFQRHRFTMKYADPIIERKFMEYVEPWMSKESVSDIEMPQTESLFVNRTEIIHILTFCSFAVVISICISATMYDIVGTVMTILSTMGILMVFKRFNRRAIWLMVVTNISIVSMVMVMTFCKIKPFIGDLSYVVACPMSVASSISSFIMMSRPNRFGACLVVYAASMSLLCICCYICSGIAYAAFVISLAIGSIPLVWHNVYLSRRAFETLMRSGKKRVEAENSRAMSRIFL